MLYKMIHCSRYVWLISCAGITARCITLFKFWKAETLLVQLPSVPTPVYPMLHVQWKLPTVLMHMALSSQSWLLVTHSSTSEEDNIDGHLDDNIL